MDMKFNELRKTKEFWVEEFSDNFYGKVVDIMNKRGYNKDSVDDIIGFAEEIDEDPMYIFYIVCGDITEVSVSKCIDICLKMNIQPPNSFVDLE